MSKTLLYVLLVGVVVVGGYFMMTGEKSEMATENTNGEAVLNEETSGKKMAFSEFLKQGGSYQCEVKQAVSDFENTGTVFISGANLRGDYETVAEGRNMKTSFIIKDGYSYMWSDMMPNVGYKIKVNTEVEGDTGAAASGTYSWNAEQIGDYNCEPWTADQSKFALPSGVNFQEMNY